MAGNDAGSIREATVARGVAAVAVVAALLVIAGTLIRSQGGTPGVNGPVCTDPVERVENSVAVLSCVGDPRLRGCEGLSIGDRATINASGCRITVGGMRAATRLLVGLPLDLNRASASELELLDGIGPVLAKATVLERERAGSFRSVDDLVRVKGIGPATVARLRPTIAVFSAAEEPGVHDPSRKGR